MDGAFFAFALTVVAGLATSFGGLMVLCTKIANKKFLAVSLSFSAGVMLYVSFAEIFLEAHEYLEEAHGNGAGYAILILSFFGGLALMALVDKFIPHDESHTDSLQSSNNNLKHVGISSAIAIAIHNFPEGFIIFMAALYDPIMGIGVAIAIIIHNIPEGIAVASPIYHGTGSKAKAFLAATAAGLTEPLGAIVGWLLFRNIFGSLDGLYGIIFAAVAGIMVFVAIHQLLPTAQKHGKHHLVMKGLFIGMGVMAVSILLLEVFG